MGIRKSSTNKEKKTALPSQSIKSIGKPSNSVHNWQETSIQFTQKKEKISQNQHRPSRNQKKPDSTPVKSLKKVIEVSYIPLGQKYSVLKQPYRQKNNKSQTYVQHNNGGQIRRLQKLKANEKNKSYIRRLIDTDLSNTHICQVVEILKEKSSILLIEEYCSDGELTQMIKKGCIQENVCAIIVEQILEIVQYLHGKGLVHGNLQLSSFGLQNTSLDLFVKLIENRNMFEKRKITVKDMPYLAPEVLTNTISTGLMPGDMWAIGIITYQLLFGKLPYENFDIKNPRNDIIKMQKKFMLCEPQLSHECQDFLQSLLKVDPNTRIKADVALQSKWIESGRSIDNKYLKPLYNLSQAKRVTYFQQCILIKMIETYQKEDECRLEKLFNQINQGKNGLLNKADIVNLYQKVYNNGNVSEDANQVFANLDTDGNNGINFQEFLIATIDKVNLFQDEHLEDTFKLLVNPQGFITLKSLLRLITCDEQFLKQEFNEFDSEKVQIYIQYQINRKKYLEIFQNLIK